LRRTAVVVDEHPLWLSGLESVLARTEVDVLGKTTSFEDGLALVDSTRPDLLVASIDPTGDELGGLDFLRRVREAAPETRAIVFSTATDAQSIDAALRAGALAYVIKTAAPEDFALTIRQAFRQSVFFERPAVAEAPAPVVDPPTNGHGLTRREVEILRLVAEGRTNSEVARSLWVTEETVKFHLSNTYRKLGVSNRTEAGRWAHQHGLLAAASQTAA
jgi:DNA-binding NarL/FixJ family response regulator